MTKNLTDYWWHRLLKVIHYVVLLLLAIIIFSLVKEDGRCDNWLLTTCTSEFSTIILSIIQTLLYLGVYHLTINTLYFEGLVYIITGKPGNGIIRKLIGKGKAMNNPYAAFYKENSNVRIYGYAIILLIIIGLLSKPIYLNFVDQWYSESIVTRWMEIGKPQDTSSTPLLIKLFGTNNHKLYNLIGQNELAEKNYASAEKFFEKSIKIKDTSSARRAMCDTIMRSDQYALLEACVDELIKVANKVLKEETLTAEETDAVKLNLAYGHTLKGMVLLEKFDDSTPYTLTNEDYQLGSEAVENATFAITLINPKKDILSYRVLLRAYIILEDYSNIVETGEKILTELDENDIFTLNELALYHKKRSGWEEDKALAIKYLDKLIALDPYNQEYSALRNELN